MIAVRYQQRLGNNLFQYCFGRILAERLGFKFKARSIAGFPNTKIKVRGHDYFEYPSQVLSGHEVDLDSILQDKSKRKIIVRGWFQRYEYYREYKDSIRSNWLLVDIQLKHQISQDDIVVCMRRGDYVRRGYALPFSYYEEALDTADYGKVFICTDSPDDPFILRLKDKYHAIIHNGGTLDDFGFIMSFNKIIISNSTFHWWASFLSKAKEIYFPIPLKGPFSQARLDINLKVDDEDRYIYGKCKEAYKATSEDELMLQKNEELREEKL